MNIDAPSSMFLLRLLARARTASSVCEAESETTDILFDFPDHLFSTEDDKKAMLAWRACDDGLVRLRAIIAQCFEGRSVHSYGRRLGVSLMVHRAWSQQD